MPNFDNLEGYAAPEHVPSCQESKTTSGANGANKQRRQLPTQITKPISPHHSMASAITSSSSVMIWAPLKVLNKNSIHLSILNFEDVSELSLSTGS